MTVQGVFIRALGLGVLVAAPVGAMALLCIQRTLAHGRRTGLATGLGIATADSLYASVAAFGLTALSAALVGAQPWVRLLGGLALIALGVRAMLARGSEGDAPGAPKRPAHAGSYASALALTLANPQTILTFVALFASAGLAVSGGWTAAAATVAGVFCGSLGWWLVLVAVVGAVRERVGGALLTWVGRGSGAAIALLGLAAVWTGVAALAT